MAVYLAPDDPKYDAIGYDQTRSEQHTKTSQLSKHPVEDGSQFIDHVLVEPDTFECEVVVTNKPMQTNWYGEGLDRYVAQVIPAQRLTPTGPVTLQGVSTRETVTLAFYGFGVTRGGNLVGEMQERHDALIDNAVSLSVLTSTKQYDSMVLVSQDLQRGTASENYGIFRLRFERIIVVTTRLVAAPKPKEARGNKVVPKGTQSETTASATPEASAQSSTLYNLLGFP